MDDREKTNEETYDRDAWLSQRPTGPEDDAFAESAARGRKELDAATAAELLGELDQSIAKRYGKGMSTIRPVATTKVRRIIPKWWAAAATVLLLLIAGYAYWAGSRGVDTQELYAANFEPYANDLSRRSMGDVDTAVLDSSSKPLSNTPLGEALLAYDRRDYTAAVDRFETYFSNGVVELPGHRFYYGVSLLAAGRAADAAGVLTELEADPQYGNAAVWYQALAALRADQPDRAVEHLRALAKNENNPFHRRAEDLLRQLN